MAPLRDAGMGRRPLAMRWRSEGRAEARPYIKVCGKDGEASSPLQRQERARRAAPTTAAGPAGRRRYGGAVGAAGKNGEEGTR